ncbi:Sigma factor binding protein 2, chloroplastic, partial [Mucuna pruriens]
MKNKRASKRDKKQIKVTYISSPVKVKASVSNFRALVQELTGQYSNVAETMPMEEENNDHLERVHKTHHERETQQWRVDVDGANFLKPEYVEPFNQQHFQYDLMSFDMS